jgi:hypothetical protein
MLESVILSSLGTDISGIYALCSRRCLLSVLHELDIRPVIYRSVNYYSYIPNA